jgi:hypothetical protein
MSSQAQAPGHIEITETLVRLYVFLTQYLDRCLDEAARKTYLQNTRNDVGHSGGESRGQEQSREGMPGCTRPRSRDLERRS